MPYIDVDCKRCGRHRVELNNVCEKCGYNQLEAEVDRLKAELAEKELSENRWYGVAEKFAAGVNITPVLLQRAERTERVEAILAELMRVIEASTYGEHSLHHHTCPAPDHGKCTCGAFEAVDAARRLAWQG